MTQVEASNILWWASKRHYPGDQMDITAEDIEAFDMAIAALRGPEHDPDTGLMKCGCGGKAKIWPSDPTQFTHQWKCSECGNIWEMHGIRGVVI